MRTSWEIREVEPAPEVAREDRAEVWGRWLAEGRYRSGAELARAVRVLLSYEHLERARRLAGNPLVGAAGIRIQVTAQKLPNDTNRLGGWHNGRGGGELTGVVFTRR